MTQRSMILHHNTLLRRKMKLKRETSCPRTMKFPQKFPNPFRSFKNVKSQILTRNQTNRTRGLGAERKSIKEIKTWGGEVASQLLLIGSKDIMIDTLEAMVAGIETITW